MKLKNNLNLWRGQAVLSTGEFETLEGPIDDRLWQPGSTVAIAADGRKIHRTPNSTPCGLWRSPVIPGIDDRLSFVAPVLKKAAKYGMKVIQYIKPPVTSRSFDLWPLAFSSWGREVIVTQFPTLEILPTKFKKTRQAY